MGTTGSASVDAYIASQPPAARRALEIVRRAIRDAVPNAGETLSYKIPTFTVDGHMVLSYAAWKNHYSVYPANDRVLAAFAAELATHDVKNSTIRFPYSEPVPVDLIQRIAAFRAAGVSER